ncbi:aspartyl-phosphate phosphatase Spo0E family protein [Ectobacillus panaciterrae]|uniref:aspartyl-phosphate phosphatase Spo0E family protein n=1 Tax=Ectobacillus panaciterrae TaxID=363872 RepID=UPI0005550E06|nr:aspartyl-phosphate phosphatase Spo0E family protein [Ectobacillus panaciterrae]
MLNLINLIEEKRNQLIHVSKLYGLTHPQTIRCSQQLDTLINVSMEKRCWCKKTLKLVYTDTVTQQKVYNRYGKEKFVQIETL